MNQEIKSIETFLSKLSIIDYKYRLLEKDKEQFNIFTALHKERDEVRLHSRFISVLLSNESSHNKKDIFLKLFLQVLAIDNFETENSKVYPSELHKSEFNNIDILIINRSTKQAIIIENKIGAGDSNHEDKGQLEGYYDSIHYKENIPKENISVFYLTLDGHMPTNESLGKYKILENINGRAIDYEHEIQNWLQLCLQKCISQAFLRESIIQYINLIKYMTNNSTNIQERLEIRELIVSSAENMESTKLLIENFKHIKWHTVWDFWYELYIELKNQGFTISSKPSENNITSTTHYEAYKKAYESSNDYGIRFLTDSGIELFVWNGSIDEWIYWGFEKKNLTPAQENQIQLFLKEKPEYLKNNETDYWKYFNLHDNENICLTDFSYKGTFDIINKNHRSTIINKLIFEINAFIKEAF